MGTHEHHAIVSKAQSKRGGMVNVGGMDTGWKRQKSDASHRATASPGSMGSPRLFSKNSVRPLISLGTSQSLKGSPASRQHGTVACTSPLCVRSLVSTQPFFIPDRRTYLIPNTEGVLKLSMNHGACSFSSHLPATSRFEVFTLLGACQIQLKAGF